MWLRTLAAAMTHASSSDPLAEVAVEAPPFLSAARRVLLALVKERQCLQYRKSTDAMGNVPVAFVPPYAQGCDLS